MAKVTICTSLLNERDKKSAENELLKGNIVSIYPTCINAKRAQALVNESEEFFKSLGAIPVKEDSETELTSKPIFWTIQNQGKFL